MKLTPMAVWRTRASPAPGSPTSTSSSRRTSGPPWAWITIARVMTGDSSTVPAAVKPLRIFAACAPGIEPLLLDEVRALGFEKASAVAGGVEMEGDLTAVYRANLELGLATHVLV